MNFHLIGILYFQCLVCIFVWNQWTNCNEICFAKISLFFDSHLFASLSSEKFGNICGSLLWYYCSFPVCSFGHAVSTLMSQTSCPSLGPILGFSASMYLAQVKFNSFYLVAIKKKYFREGRKSKQQPSFWKSLFVDFGET